MGVRRGRTGVRRQKERKRKRKKDREIDRGVQPAVRGPATSQKAMLPSSRSVRLRKLGLAGLGRRYASISKVPLKRTGFISGVKLVGASAIFLLGHSAYCTDATTTLTPQVPLVVRVQVVNDVESNISLGQRCRKALERAASCLKDWILIFLRTLYLTGIFAPVAIAAPCAYLISDLSTDFAKWWWDLLRESIRISGPCNTKLAQWIATRPDLFPQELCRQLQILQVRAQHHTWEETREVLTRMFPPGWDADILVDIDAATNSPLTVGSGCVADVFSARLKSRGMERVAIKVIHPGVADSIDADLRIMRAVVWITEHLPGMSKLSLREVVEEFAEFMYRQLDLRLEAKALQRFRHNFGCDAKAHEKSKKEKLFRQVVSNRPGRVTFPDPREPYVTQLALVETFEEGDSISEYLHSDNETRRKLAIMGLDTVLKMVFEDNFIHADLHMGNIIVRKANESKERGIGTAGDGSPTLDMAMIDAGLVAELGPEDRRNFIDLFKAVVRNDGRLVGRLMIERSRDHGAGCLNPEAFEREMEAVVAAVHSSGLALGRIGVGALLQRVLIACYTHGVKLESKYASVIIGIGVLEGLGRQLDPDVDILMRAAPYVFKAALNASFSNPSEGPEA